MKNGFGAKRQNWRQWWLVSDISKNWAQVLGLIVAGVWVSFTFALQTCPAREKQLASESKLTWLPGPTPDTCIANLYVKVTNISTRSVYVRRVEAQIWNYKVSVPQSVNPTYIDSITNPKDPQQYLFQHTFTGRTAPLVDELSPKGSVDNDFQWVFRRPAVRSWVSIELQMFEDTAGKRRVWDLYENDIVCPPG
jgi:hypothetical protein